MDFKHYSTNWDINFLLLFVLFFCEFYFLFPACVDRPLQSFDSPGRHLGDPIQMSVDSPPGLSALEPTPQFHSAPPSSDVISLPTPSVFRDRVVSPSSPVVPIKKSRLSLGRSYNSTRKSGNGWDFFIVKMLKFTGMLQILLTSNKLK